VPMILIGNKMDLIENRAVEQADAEEYAKKYGFKLIWTSAATGEKVEEAFIDLVTEIIKHLEG
ncbi:MAG: Rab family GTPase, partial [Promethearchaeota archaeon]